jgi:alpha-2-macroglobulin
MAAIARVNSRHDASVQAAAIYLLTRHGVVTTNYALNLRDSLNQISKDAWLEDNSAAWLAATLRLLKKDDEAKKLIAAHWKALRGAKSGVGSGRFYESSLTRSAQSFVIVCRHFPEIAGTFGYDDLRLITEPIGDGGFHTLGAAWSVLAFRAYAGLAKDSGINVGIAETGDLTSVFAAPAVGLVSGKFSLNAKTLRFSLERPNGAPDLGAWYQSIEAGFDKTAPVVAETKGLEVTRILDAAASIKVGDTLRMRVRVRNVNALPQTHIAVNDLFPAGFDLAPDGLKPGLGAAGAEYVDVREDRAIFFTSLLPGESKTFEYPVRAICAGTFAVPPPFAENMYDRAVHGIGIAGSVTVAPRE